MSRADGLVVWELGGCREWCGIRREFYGFEKIGGVGPIGFRDFFSLAGAHREHDERHENKV